VAGSRLKAVASQNKERSLEHGISAPTLSLERRSVLLYKQEVKFHATSRKVAGSSPHEVIGFFSWPNPSSRTIALGSTQPLTEMSTRNLPGEGGGGRKGRPERKADNLTAICEPIV
jgi:hypothetical protein